jgi:hypothetical protein
LPLDANQGTSYFEAAQKHTNSSTLENTNRNDEPVAVTQIQAMSILKSLDNFILTKPHTNIYFYITYICSLYKKFLLLLYVSTLNTKYGYPEKAATTNTTLCKKLS